MNVTGPRPFVFVLMPFEKSFDDIYHLGIKETCDKAGSYAERVDEQTYDGTITQRIYNQIAKADFIVADMTGRNANVFYETGYAHALNKRVILLTQNAEHIPFDLRDRPHIVYNNSIRTLQDELFKWLRWAIENPIEDIHLLSPPIQFYIDRVPLLDNPVIPYFHAVDSFIRILVDAHNSAEKSIRPIRFRLCLVSSDRFTHSIEDHRKGGLPAALLPDGGRMHVFSKTYEILPGGWESWIRMDVAIDKPPLEEGSVHKFVLRLLTDGQPVDFPFTVSIAKPET